MKEKKQKEKEEKERKEKEKKEKEKKEKEAKEKAAKDKGMNGKLLFFFLLRLWKKKQLYLLQLIGNDDLNDSQKSDKRRVSFKHFFFAKL